jgi:hypothetical protein
MVEAAADGAVEEDAGPVLAQLLGAGDYGGTFGGAERRPVVLLNIVRGAAPHCRARLKLANSSGPKMGTKPNAALDSPR